MIEFAVQMTIDVHRIDGSFVQQVRARGLTDEDLLNTAEVAGFFNYYTRLADALGVEPEDFMVKQTDGDEPSQN